MDTTLDLLDKALQLKPSPEWTKQLGVHRNALHTAKQNGHLTPVIAGNLALELGEDPAQWVLKAVMEGERDSPAKERLIARLGAKWRKR